MTTIVTATPAIVRVSEATHTRLVKKIRAVEELYVESLLLMYHDHLRYLPLPSNITAITGSELDRQLYEFGLLVGRCNYQLLLYDLDDTGALCRDPEPLETDEVLTIVHDFIYPDDRRDEVMIPLSLRVGCAMGFLSGVHVVQREQAYEGLVILSALVAPLLLHNAAAAIPERQGR